MLYLSILPCWFLHYSALWIKATGNTVDMCKIWTQEGGKKRVSTLRDSVTGCMESLTLQSEAFQNIFLLSSPAET